jgi:hypothetical protein
MRLGCKPIAVPASPLHSVSEPTDAGVGGQTGSYYVFFTGCEGGQVIFDYDTTQIELSTDPAFGTLIGGASLPYTYSMPGFKHCAGHLFAGVPSPGIETAAG